VEIPVFDRENCEPDASPAQEARPVTSRISASIRTADGKPVPAAAIEHLVVGVRANERFRAAMTDPESWGADGPLLSQLDREDRTVVLLWARGYRLAPNQNFLRLDPGFEPGREIRLDLVIESTGASIFAQREQTLSAAGTKAELPSLRAE
jgi:hypothetical protein